MHRINLRGPWRGAREADVYSLLRNFHAPPNLDARLERVRLSLLLATDNVDLRVQLNGSDAPILIGAPPARDASGSCTPVTGVLGQCDITTILKAYNSIVLSWSGADAAQLSLPLGELRLSPSSHPLLLDAWLEIDE